MKRISALICAMMLVLMVLAPACFAAKDVAADETPAKSNLEIVSTSPEDGAQGVAVDNLSIKIQFDKAVKPDNKDADKRAKVRENNAKQFKLTDEEGTKIPVRVYYSDDTEGLILVAADINSLGKNGQVKSNMAYTLSIGKNFKATDGSTLAAPTSISVKTLNQTRSTIIYTALMVLMMVGMVVFTARSAKKAKEKEEEEKKNGGKKQEAGLNPYKEAKKTGKSIEEIVQEENKKKSKQALAEAKRKEELAALEAKILEEMRRERNKRVSGPRPISAAGSTYKVEVKYTKKKKEAPVQKTKSKGSHGKQRHNKK